MALSQGDGWYFLSIGCHGLGMDGLEKVKWGKWWHLSLICFQWHIN